MNMNTLDKSSVITRIKTSEFTKTTLVIIPIYWYHYVEPITEGTRYVFKNSVTSKNINSFNENDLCD